MSTALLEARGVSREFRVRRAGDWLGRRAVLRAVDDVTLSVRKATTLGVVGESGCGKSTLGRLLLGMLPPTRGEVRFAGEVLETSENTAWRRQRRRMQMIFQDPLGALDRRIPIGGQIAEPLTIHAIGDQPERARRVAQVLDAVGLSPQLAERYPHELSGGQRQRAVIARALVVEPELIVCDEPVSALDVSIQAQVVNLLRMLQRRLGITYVFISHDLKVVHHLSHDIAVMYLGRVVEQGSRERLFAKPEHPYTRALIAAVPVPDPERRRERIMLAGDPPSPLAIPSGCRFHTRCPHAAALCREVEPALAPLPDGHRVACHLATGAIAAPARAA
jgi:peptide/nickel transport system ATP-binding protein